MKRLNLKIDIKAASLVLLCSLFFRMGSSPPAFVMSPSARANDPIGSERDQYSQLDLESIAAPTLLKGKNPMVITLSIFGIQETGEGNFQQKVEIKPLGDNQKRIYLTQQNLPDDSVRGLRYLLEFER